MLASTTPPRHPKAASTRSAGLTDGSTAAGSRETCRQESRSMFRNTTAPTPTSDLEDRSMRFVEYAMAIVAVVAAGVLALIR
jgi:hypothetical protein